MGGREQGNGLLMVLGLRSYRRDSPRIPEKEIGSISQKTVSGWVSLDGVCLSIFQGQQRPQRTG